MTIIDVSGQIVYREIVEDAVNGQKSWDMFSQDGTEVASGLYIYHIEYGSGRLSQATSPFSGNRPTPERTHLDLN